MLQSTRGSLFPLLWPVVAIFARLVVVLAHRFFVLFFCGKRSLDMLVVNSVFAVH